MSIKKLKTLQSKIDPRGTQFFKKQLSIALEMMHKESVAQLRNSNLNLLEVHQYLDTQYLLENLEYSCYLLAQNKHHVSIELGETLSILNLLKPLFENGTEVLLRRIGWRLNWRN